MRNIRLTIEYEGKSFNGWQKQPNKLNIQGEIEKAIEEITGEEVDLIASGRTDAGVNALAQIANFRTNSNIEIEKLPYAINSKLKKSILIKNAEEVDERFHSRYSVHSKTYRYTINNSKFGTAIFRDMEYHFPIELDEKLMAEGAKYLVGKHDFKSFKASGTSSKSSVRTIYDIKVWRENERIYIEITGNGFLYNMVRIIAGTLVDVGIGKYPPTYVKEILDGQDRTLAGKTLAARGLCLIKVDY